jgi:hypothetical protein
MTKKWTMPWCVVATVTVTLLSGMTLAGCGGGGSDRSSSAEQDAITVISRATDGAFSESARILAARDAESTGEIWINAAVARAYDRDLAAIRRAFPEVEGIQAFPRQDLKSVIVTLSPDAPWARGWTTENLLTGEAALDDLLRQYSLEKIERIGDFERGGPIFFVLRFAQSLNTPPLTERIKAASAKIATANPNGIVGDGDNIIRTPTAAPAGSRRYILSRGSGDCPAGCTERTSWEFTVSPDGNTATFVQKVGGTLK